MPVGISNEVWVKLNENAEELLLKGVPKPGDSVLLYYTRHQPDENEVLAIRKLDTGTNADYVSVEINSLNAISGA